MADPIDFDDADSHEYVREKDECVRCMKRGLPLNREGWCQDCWEDDMDENEELGFQEEEEDEWVEYVLPDDE